jgi:hypothetical protein
MYSHVEFSVTDEIQSIQVHIDAQRVWPKTFSEVQAWYSTCTRISVAPRFLVKRSGRIAWTVPS